MKERHNRLSVVKELRKNNRIENQDTLLELLKKEDTVLHRLLFQEISRC